MRVVVIGAGISGIVTAYMLARRGCEVTIVDRAAGIADETSYANGGVVGGTQIEPWATPGLQWHLLKWIGREDAPLLVRLNQLPKITGWGLRFLRSCNERRFAQAIEASGRLTRHSLAMFETVRTEAKIDPAEYALLRHGAIKVYLTEQSFDTACREAEQIRALGFDVHPVDRSGCVAQEPGLAPVADALTGGVVYRDEEIGNCRLFAKALGRRLEALGVEFRMETAVRRIRTAGNGVDGIETAAGTITADAYVVATASHSNPLLRTAGLHVPVIPIKGVTISVPSAPWPDAVRGAVMDHSRLFGLIRIGDQMRISGSAEITGYDTTPQDARCEAIIANVLELFPAFAPCLAGTQSRWAGVRGNTPDGPPVLGPTPIRNLFLNIGHGPQGWSTSCGCADIVADCVVGRSPAIDMSGLTLGRF